MTSLTVAFVPSQRLLGDSLASGATSFTVGGQDVFGEALKFKFSADQAEFANCLLASRAPYVQQRPLFTLQCTEMRSHAGLQHLLEKLPPTLLQLELDLSAKKVSDVGLQRLSEKLPPTLQQLKLHLRNTEVSDAGLQRLSEKLPPTLQQLELHLCWNTEVSDTGLQRLSEKLPPTLQQLKLHLRNTKVSGAALQCLSEKLPPTVQLKVEAGRPVA